MVWNLSNLLVGSWAAKDIVLVFDVERGTGLHVWTRTSVGKIRL